MRKKVIGLSLAFTLAAGMAAVGASYIESAAPVKADDETRTIYCKMEHSWWKADSAAVGVHYWGGVTGTSWPGLRMTAVEGETDIWSYDIPAAAENVIFTRVNPSGDIADWGAKTKNLTVPTNGQDMFTIASSSPVWGDPGCDGTWGVYVPSTAKYYVSVDGVKEELVKNPDNADECMITGVTTTGTNPLVFYLEDMEIGAVTVKKDTGLNANNAYAKDNGKIYVRDFASTISIYYNKKANNVWVTGRTTPLTGYFGVGGWENVYVYSHGGYAEGSGEYALGAWPGVKLTPISGVRFETHESQGYGLYPFELPVNSTGKNNNVLIFNNGAEDPGKIQTADLTIVDGAYYGAHYTETGDTKRGAAAKFVETLVSLLTSGAYTHGDLANSVCALSTTEAQWACAQYNALAEDVKGYVDGASYYTYVDSTSDAKQDWSFADIFTQISVIAGNAGSGSKFYTSLNNNSTFLVSVIVISTLAIAGLAILYIRKRKSIKE